MTQRAIEALVARGGPLVAILWGQDAQSLIPLLGSVPYLASAHPSPLSAAAGLLRVTTLQPRQRALCGRAESRSTGLSKELHDFAITSEVKGALVSVLGSCHGQGSVQIRDQDPLHPRCRR